MHLAAIYILALFRVSARDLSLLKVFCRERDGDASACVFRLLIYSVTVLAFWQGLVRFYRASYHICAKNINIYNALICARYASGTVRFTPRHCRHMDGWIARNSPTWATHCYYCAARWHASAHALGRLGPAARTQLTWGYARASPSPWPASRRAPGCPPPAPAPHRVSRGCPPAPTLCRGAL